MDKIIVFSAPDKQNEAAKETAMQYARAAKEEADRAAQFISTGVDELTTIKNDANAAVVSAEAYANDYVSPVQFGAIGTGDDYPALVEWLDYLAATGKTGWIGRDFRFGSKITHAGAVKIRGPFSDNARLIYTGEGDGIELTGAADVDGIVVDGNLPINAVPELTSEAGCLFGIHGPMMGTPGYLSGVKIGRVRVQNTRRRASIALVNLSNFDIERIETSRTYGNAIHWCGLIDGKIGTYSFDRVGNLASEGSRLGAGLAIYAEGDASKKPAIWYEVAGVMPSDNVDIGGGQGSRTTDTSIYVHDSYGKGIGNIRFGHYQGTLIGKDGVKFRGGVKNVTMPSCQVRKVGLRAAVIEDEGSENCAIDNVDGDQIGYDALGEWLGGDKNYTGGSGAGETLNLGPSGVMFAYAKNSRITGRVRRIYDKPNDAKEGRPFQFSHCTGCELKLDVDTADGIGLFRNLNNCSLDILVKDARRNGGDASAAVYCDDNKQNGNYWESKNSSIKIKVVETELSPQMDYPLRINGDGSGYDLTLEFDPSKFNRPEGISVRADAAKFRSFVAPGLSPRIITSGSGLTPYPTACSQYEITLAANFGIINAPVKWAGAILRFVIKQDATGGRTLNFGSDFRLPAGWVLSSAPSSMNLIEFRCDSEKWNTINYLNAL